MTETAKDIERASLPIPLFGHVGDGNFHLVILIDPGKPKEIEEAKAINARVVERALAMEGTCTGEHGVGIGKQPYLRKELGEDVISIMRDIKQLLDPENLMNPGKSCRYEGGSRPARRFCVHLRRTGYSAGSCASARRAAAATAAGGTGQEPQPEARRPGVVVPATESGSVRPSRTPAAYLRSATTHAASSRLRGPTHALRPTRRTRTRAASVSAEKRLKELNIDLGAVSAPVANYVNAVRTGNLLYLAGKGPRPGPDGRRRRARWGATTVEQAYQHARTVGLDLLAVMRQELGSLDKVKRVVKVLGMVNAAPDFEDHPKVINGCSDLFVQVLGDKGKHARSAVGMGSLPMDIPVEIEVIVEVE